MSARSRSPADVVASMLSSNRRASAGSRAELLPERTTWRGPRTEAAGFAGTTWPLTSQSNRYPTAASRCLTLGLRPGVLQARFSSRRAAAEYREGKGSDAHALGPLQKLRHSSRIGTPRVWGGDLRPGDFAGEESPAIVSGLRLPMTNAVISNLLRFSFPVWVTF